MTRNSKLILLTLIVVLILACNTVTQPVRDVQNIAGTAESFASAIPFETLQALPSALPLETLESLPSELDNFNYFDPQGDPVAEWNGVPVMPQATAGQEFADSNTYSYKVDASAQDVQDYYNSELPNRGWESTFNVPGDANGAVMLFSNDNNFLTITITVVDGETVVVLTSG